MHLSKKSNHVRLAASAIRCIHLLVLVLQNHLPTAGKLNEIPSRAAKINFNAKEMCLPGYTAAMWSKNEKMYAMFYRSLTVDDRDVSVLVVFWQCDWGTGDGGNGSDRPAAVRAVKVACSHCCLVPPTDSCGSTRQPTSSQASTQAVREAEWIPRPVTTVRLVDPLHHRCLGGHAGVLTWQDHWLEQHSIPLLISHIHMNP